MKMLRLLVLVSVLLLLLVGCQPAKINIQTSDFLYGDCDNAFKAVIWTETRKLDTLTCRTSLTVVTTSEAETVHIRILTLEPVSVVDGDGESSVVADNADFVVNPGEAFTARMDQ